MKLLTKTRLPGAIFALFMTGHCAVSEAATADRPVSRYFADVPAPAMEIHRGIKYVVPGTAQLMDIYMPEHVTGTLPAIVYIHGGGWLAGSRSSGEASAKHFTGRGYIFCSVDYRFSSEAIYPAQIEDCKCAIRYLRANAAQYHIDPAHIGAWGDSAGGHLVSLLGTTAHVAKLEGAGPWQNESSAVQAVLDWYGPTDFDPKFFKEYTNADGRRMMQQLLGSLDDTQLAADASPVTFVARGDPPFLIEQGDKDPLVPVSQSRALYDALKAVDDDVALKIIPGAGHGGGEFFTADNITMIDAFFDRVLKPAAPE